MKTTAKVVVVGAGLGGLSAAAHLIGAGHDVTIVERDAIPGGRAGMITEQGFRLDNGPTVLTMPNLLEDAFNAAGAEMKDFITINPVDPMYRAVYADGSTLFVRHGREAMTQEIREFSGAKDAEAFGRFCTWLERLYRAEMDSFIDANFDSPLDLIKPWKSGLELVKLGGFGKLGKKVASFFDDERLQRIFSFQSMYAGLAPYEALALYAVITYMDSVEGVFVPEGGMHMMAAGLADAVTAAGVEIRYSSPVTRILRKPGGAPSPASRSEHPNASTPTPSSATSTSRSPTANCCRASTRRVLPATASTRRRVCCGWRASRACRPPTPATTTSTSARTGTARSRR